MVIKYTATCQTVTYSTNPISARTPTCNLVLIVPSLFFSLFFSYLACGRNIRSHPVIEKCETGRLRAITALFFQPWAVAILENGKLICNGMLISEEWVLTGTSLFYSMSYCMCLLNQVEFLPSGRWQTKLILYLNASPWAIQPLGDVVWYSRNPSFWFL